jgi:hypothetical protein
VSWEIPIGFVRLDPAPSGVVVVRHGGQLDLRGGGQDLSIHMLDQAHAI